MLNNREKFTVVTFPNTSTALAMEAACNAQGMPGRIIPIPDQINAGCGFAWLAAEEDRIKLENFLEVKGLVFDCVYTLELDTF
jgi:hypothetical protein